MHEKVRTYRDDNSKAIGHIVEIIGAPLLRKLNFKHVRKLISFLYELERVDINLFKTHPSLDTKKINAST